MGYDTDSSAPPRSGRQSQDPDFGMSPTTRKQSEDFSIGRRSEIDPYGGVEPFSPPPPPVPANGVRRRPSEDRRRPSQDTTGRRRPSESHSITSDSTSATNAQSATAGMIIPNKSTIAEEEIEVPYGREVRESTGTAMDEREQRGRDRIVMDPFRDQSGERSRGTDTEGDDDLRSPTGGLAGLSALSARLQASGGNGNGNHNHNNGIAIDEDEDEGGRSSAAGARSGDDYYEKMSYGRTSVASDRSAGGRMGSAGMAGVGGVGGGRSSVGGEEQERMRRDYEFRIATMQSRITGLERELEDAHSRDADRAHSEDRARIMEDELDDLRRVSDLFPHDVYAFLISSFVERGGKRCWYEDAAGRTGSGAGSTSSRQRCRCETCA